MKLLRRLKILSILFSCLFVQTLHTFAVQQQPFVVVIDPGHGGRDPGAVGRISKEKNITLSVARILGSLIESNMRDVKVVYTRKTDVFVGLEDRAMIANNHKSNLFISIHTNAAKNRNAFGAETFVLGLAKTQANLEVAMKENSVIMLEEDYKTRYQGFDPTSVDSYIMFEFMMDKYLESSLLFASKVQNQFVNTTKRHDRGVRQAGFWVLHRTASPSVLIELGFISNRNEELYLASERGQQELARAIYNAFVAYKREHDRKLGFLPPTSTSTTNTVTAESAPVQATTAALDTTSRPVATTMQQQPVFKLQILSSASPLQPNSNRFKGVPNVQHFQEDGLYKYTIGNETDYQKVIQLRNQLRPQFPDAFIIAFLGNRKISVQEALRLIGH